MDLAVGRLIEVMSDEVVQIVKILDGDNRHRFIAQPDLLAAWTAARNVVRTGGRADKCGRTDGDSIQNPATVGPDSARGMMESFVVRSQT